MFSMFETMSYENISNNKTVSATKVDDDITNIQLKYSKPEWQITIDIPLLVMREIMNMYNIIGKPYSYHGTEIETTNLRGKLIIRDKATHNVIVLDKAEVRALFKFEKNRCGNLHC